jgi:uncharacterized protein YdhG (YjbR/CyaY superfamily)
VKALRPNLTVDAYIATFPPAVRAVLKRVRATVRAAAPKAEERISYRMPAFFQDGVVIYYAAFKQHLGVFPPVRDPTLQAAIAPYAGPKGNLKFPFANEIPYALIRRIVKARLRENRARLKARAR